MEDRSNIIGFTSYIYNGRREYGCRGWGKDYAAFYKWVNTTSYKCMRSDMPWDYFVFDRAADELLFLSKYRHLIHYQTEDQDD